MASQMPKLLLIILLFISFSTKEAQAIAATTTPYTLVNDLCNRKDILANKPFCLNIFKSDPRVASATGYLTLFKLAMKQAITNFTKTENYFTFVGKSKPALKPALDLCVTGYYKHLIVTFQSYYHQVVETSGKMDTEFLTYDFQAARDDIIDCGSSLDSAGIHNKSLLETNGVAMKYFLVCYELIKVVTNTMN